MDAGGSGCVGADPLAGRQDLVYFWYSDAAGGAAAEGAGVLLAADGGGAGVCDRPVCRQLPVFPAKEPGRRMTCPEKKEPRGSFFDAQSGYLAD